MNVNDFTVDEVGEPVPRTEPKGGSKEKSNTPTAKTPIIDRSTSGAEHKRSHELNTTTPHSIAAFRDNMTNQVV